MNLLHFRVVYLKIDQATEVSVLVEFEIFLD